MSLLDLPAIGAALVLDEWRRQLPDGTGRSYTHVPREKNDADGNFWSVGFRDDEGLICLSQKTHDIQAISAESLRRQKWALLGDKERTLTRLQYTLDQEEAAFKRGDEVKPDAKVREAYDTVLTERRALAREITALDKQMARSKTVRYFFEPSKLKTVRIEGAKG